MITNTTLSHFEEHGCIKKNNGIACDFLVLKLYGMQFIIQGDS